LSPQHWRCGPRRRQYFTPERKGILDGIRDELRKRDYLPVLFDFDKPSNRDITETASTLSHMAKFVIADIHRRQEYLAGVDGDCPGASFCSSPVASSSVTAGVRHVRAFQERSVGTGTLLYEDQDRLLAVLNDKVIGPAEAKAKEQTGR
jgi:hypothetical protein